MKKEITLVIPTPILISKQLSKEDKLVFGLHYAYFKKGNVTFETNIEVGKRLLIHPNTISKSNRLFVDNELIKRENSSYVVIKETLDKLEKNDKIAVEEIFIPFEVYSRNINVGAKLLWGEYNRFRNTEAGYVVSKEKTADYIGSSLASITNWTKQLDKEGLLEEYTIKYGKNGSQRMIRTKDLNKKEKKSLPME